MKNALSLLWALPCLILPALCGCPSAASAQSTSISGYIKDSLSAEALIGATIFAPDFKAGATANNYGFYALSVPAEPPFEVVVSYVGYRTRRYTITVDTKGKRDFLLPQKDNTLQEVVVSAKPADQNVQQARMSVIDLPIKDIKSIAMIAGERDVLKAVQFLPGVQTGNEGTTGFYVRGGNTDQNLVLLDEATVYNPNHLFGLFSTFNVNALNNVTLIKGGFPAQFGGRLSSILDITMREGNNKKFQGEGGIGLLSSNLTLEGPLQKGKSSYIISARRSYADLLAKPLLRKSNEQGSYFLYDVNAKVNYILGKNDHVFLSFFKGLDNASYTAANSLNYGINFGNTTGTFRWNHLIGSKMFVNTAVIFTNYHLSLSTSQNNFYSLLYTGVVDKSAKTTLEWYPNNKHSIKVGAQYIYHALTPAAVSARIPRIRKRIQLKPDSLMQVFSNESAFFINDEWIANRRLGLNFGLRIPYFFTQNSAYPLVEPRVTAKYSLDDATSLKLAYTDMNQFLHLVPNSTASLPTDIWISSSDIVKPQKSRQVALGLFRNFARNRYETSIEAYYKTMRNQALFKEGTQIVVDSDLDEKLTFGNGTSYGLELFVRKSEGKLTGWVAYTLSKTTQQFAALNLGRSFPFTYDRRHVLNVVAMYQLNKKWSFAGNFVFNSGGAYTLPVGRIPVYEGGGSLYDDYYSDYTDRNNYRLNAAHRLDLSASCKKTSHLFRWHYDSEWVFSLYNVYSRRNPYFVYLTTDPVTKEPKAKQVSLIPIIPGVSYNFKF